MANKLERLSAPRTDVSDKTITLGALKARLHSATLNLGFSTDRSYSHFVDYYALKDDQVIVDRYPSLLSNLEQVQNKVGSTRELQFAEPPKSLTPDVLTKTSGMKLLAVPSIPFSTPGEIAHELRAPGKLKDMYGDYLRAALNGAAPVNMTGHYALIDEPGEKTPLSSMLGIDDLNAVSPKELAQAIRAKGKEALKTLGIKGAHISVVSLEEVYLSKALGDEIDGFTSTAIRGVEGTEFEGSFFSVKDGELAASKMDQTNLSPRLVIRFADTKTQPTYLKPPVDKLREDLTARRKLNRTKL